MCVSFPRDSPMKRRGGTVCIITAALDLPVVPDVQHQHRPQDQRRGRRIEVRRGLALLGTVLYMHVATWKLLPNPASR
jgi:hypothetical protein